MDNLEIVKEIHGQIQNSDESSFKDHLQRLKTIPISYEILKETKIAKTIKKIEKKYPALKYQVKELIEKWRGVVNQKKKPKEIPVHFDDSRNKVLKIFSDLLGDKEKAFDIETELHKFGPAVYASKARSLKFNLSKNEELRESVISGRISAEELVKMNPKDMVSEESKQERKKIESDLTESKRSDWNAVNNAPKGGMFKCKRCGSDKTLTQQMQTRSADEPMTTFVKCVNCDNSWKF